MAVNLEFYADLNTKSLYSNVLFASPYVLPTLVQGDTVALSIGMVSALPSSGPGSLSESTITGYSCVVAIGTEGTTPLTSVTLTESGNRLVGNLPLTTAAIAALFSPTPAASFNRSLEIEFTDATGVLTIKRKIDLVGELITSATTDTPAPDVAIGKAEIANLYIAKSGANAIILIDQSGAGNDLLLWNDGGNLKTDPIT
jgi:hypothetical protein